MHNTKTIIIAGATGNIGKGVAYALAKRGARLVLLGRKWESLQMLADNIYKNISREKIGYSRKHIETKIIDFTDHDSVRNTAQEILTQYPHIHALILSVGQMIQQGPTILSNGNEQMFATSVIGPFLFTQLLIDRLKKSKTIVVQVIAPFYEEIDWDDVQSIQKHKTMVAFNRVKTCERALSGEMARKYAGHITCMAYNPSFIIDKTDPDLKKRWPGGMTGFIWRLFALIAAKPPSVAGEPLADIVLSYPGSKNLNGVMYKLKKLVKNPDKAMNDKIFGQKLWNELMILTGLREW